MSGLGDAIQQIGGFMMNMAKDERLSKLQKEKEERARQDELAKEERQRLRELNKVDGKPTIIERDGKKLYQYKNSEGRTINEEEVDPFTLQRLMREEQKEDLSIEGLILGNKGKGLNVSLAEKKLADYDEDEAADDAYQQARIGSMNRANRGDGGGGLESALASTDQSPGALTNILVKEFSDLGDMYSRVDVDGNKIAEGDTSTKPAITEQEFRDIASKVVIMAAKRGIDPRLSLQEAVKAFVRNKKKK